MAKHKSLLRKEISLILVIKLILIFMLWILFFQHPIEEKLTNQDIAEHIVT